MKQITYSELLTLFPKAQVFIEQRLGWDGVEGIVVFERTEGPGRGAKVACVFGAPYTLKRWRDADGKYLGDTSDQKAAVAYYEKPHDSDEVQV